jgi:hypothetical protein
MVAAVTQSSPRRRYCVVDTPGRARSMCKPCRPARSDLASTAAVGRRFARHSGTALHGRVFSCERLQDQSRGRERTWPRPRSWGSPRVRRSRSSGRTPAGRHRSCSSTGCGCCRVAGWLGRRVRAGRLRGGHAVLARWASALSDDEAKGALRALPRRRARSRAHADANANLNPCTQARYHRQRLARGGRHRAAVRAAVHLIAPPVTGLCHVRAWTTSSAR